MTISKWSFDCTLHISVYVSYYESLYRKKFSVKWWLIVQSWEWNKLTYV
jgi:hypothetical protein